MSISSFTRSSNRSPLLPTVRSYFSSIALVICWSLAGLLGCGDGGGEPAPLPDFSLSATALTGASPGQKALIAVNAKGVNGHDYPITLTIASNPDHVTGSAEVGLTESGKTANLYAYVPTYASQGPYHLEILGSDGFLTHSLPIDLYTEPSPFSVEVLQNSGDPSKRINIVLLGDGYRAEDQSKLTQDATKCLESFWNTPPYSNYRSFFNVKLVHVVSKENGASSRMNGVGVLRDTALGAYFGALGVDRAVVVDDERVFSTAMAAAPEFSRLLVLVNDTRYGGTGGSIAVVSTDPMSSETFEHEFGHTFANLADEYSDEYEELSGNIEEYPNITAQVDRALIKWTLWILPDTPIPTPNVAENVSRVGLFEGAYYQQFGVYRPRLICKMRLLEVPFCEVCAEATICEVYNDVPIIESASPNVPVSLPSTGSMTFSIAHATPEPNTLGIVWMLDGHSIAHGTDSYQLVGAGMSPGQHLLEVQITDATPLVRNDPGNLLKGTASWTVNVSASAASAQAVIPSFRAEQLLQHRLLHLSWDAGGFRVLDDRIVDLPLPPKRRSDVSSWWVEVVDEGGQVIHHEDLEDPTLLRGEFRNSENSSRIDHIVRHKLPASFMLRLPCSVSGTLRIYARDGKTATSSIAPGLIGTVPLPNR